MGYACVQRVRRKLGRLSDIWPFNLFGPSVCCNKGEPGGELLLQAHVQPLVARIAVIGGQLGDARIGGVAGEQNAERELGAAPNVG